MAPLADRTLLPAGSPDWTVRVTAPDRDAASARDLAAADDQTLVDAARAGRRDAFDAIVRRHQRQVYSVCRRFAATHEDASDLAQDVFVRAYRGLHGYRGHAALSTWLYRIAVNVCLNRAAVKPAPVDALDAEPADHRGEAPEAALLRGERVARVRAAIARLPKKQRATLILRVYHDLRHEDIAAVLGSSVGAAKANFFHALANLRRLLEGRA